MNRIGTPARGRVRCRAAACAWVVAVTTVVIIDTSPTQAATKLYVANNGTDNAECGPADKPPCRSISRAIEHATAGDQIIVGPGLYGDLNRDRAVNPSGDSGEEAPVSIGDVPLMSGTVNLAMINIDKPLTIVSRDGADATVIDADGEFVNGSLIAVNAAADGVVFGKSGKGFTIRHAALGVYVNGAAGVTVGGTIADTCYQGFLVGSPSGETPAQGTVLKGNVAVSTSFGGFMITEESAVVKGNLAKANFFMGFGILGSSSTVISKNLAIGNLGYGFLVVVNSTAAPILSKNAAIGNTDAGMFVTGTGSAPAVMTVEQNTFFGNGVRPQYPPANCGLVIQNPGVEKLTVDADGNYWGAASGPGANPADAAGGSCTAGAVTLNLNEWAGTEIKVKPPTIR